MDFTTMMQANKAAETYGVPPAIFTNLIKTESGGRQYNADGSVLTGPPTRFGSAIGLTQLLPGTAKDLGVDPTDPEQNLMGGAAYLRKQFDRFGNWEQALQAYNTGPENVANGNVPLESHAYATKILNGTQEGLAANGQAPFTNPSESHMNATGDKAGQKGSASTFFGLNLQDTGLFVIGAVVLGIGLAVSVFGAKDRIIQSVVKAVP